VAAPRIAVALVAALASAAAVPSAGQGAGTPAPCRSAQLRLLVGSAGAGAGTSWSSLVFVNVGRACALRGFPGVSALAGGRQIGAAARRERGNPPQGAARVDTVILAHDGTASSVLRQPNAQNYPASACRPRLSSVLRVYPPGETRPLSAPYARLECSTGRPILGVTPIAAGPGPLVDGA
jgi:hypothetical protein